MNNFLASLRMPAGISSLLLLPFVLLERINRRSYGEAFPFALFGWMWLLPLAFVLALRPVFSECPGRKPGRAQPGCYPAGPVGWAVGSHRHRPDALLPEGPALCLR
jgi:hypothetical protein